jgi:hypothetical protein
MITYLYIKAHNKTGLKYFGQTKYNPFAYKGSGLYWKRHLKTHGDDITTIIYYSDDDVNIIKEKALHFSKENNIVNSDEWANLREEDGVWGSPVGAHAGIKNGMYGKVGPNTSKIMPGVSKSNISRSKRVIAFGVEYFSVSSAKISCGISHREFWEKLKNPNDKSIIYHP